MPLACSALSSTESVTHLDKHSLGACLQWGATGGHCISDADNPAQTWGEGGTHKTRRAQASEVSVQTNTSVAETSSRKA